MNKIMLGLFAITTIQSTYPASMTGFKALNASAASAFKPPASMKGSKALAKAKPKTAGTNSAATAQPTVMEKLEQLRTDPEPSIKRHYNSMIAWRGMVHNHPDLKRFSAKQLMFLGVNNACQVAIVMACRAQDMHRLTTVVTSLEETPLTTPAGCDGTTCRKLLDDAKSYVDVYCSDCWSYHALNEHCYCTCYTTLHHDQTCPRFGQHAMLYADKLVAKELELRELEKVNAVYRQQQKAAFEKRLKMMKESWDKLKEQCVKPATTATASTTNI